MPKGTKKYNVCQENILIAAIIKVLILVIMVVHAFLLLFIKEPFHVDV